jgi:hypothetical protein
MLYIIIKWIKVFITKENNKLIIIGLNIKNT